MYCLTWLSNVRFLIQCTLVLGQDMKNKPNGSILCFLLYSCEAEITKQWMLVILIILNDEFAFALSNLHLFLLRETCGVVQACSDELFVKYLGCNYTKGMKQAQNRNSQSRFIQWWIYCSGWLVKIFYNSTVIKSKYKHFIGMSRSIWIKVKAAKCYILVIFDETSKDGFYFTIVDCALTFF